MNANELFERLRGLLAKATPGPWYTLDSPWLPAGAETSILAESPDPHVARFICDFDLWALDDDEDRKSECPDADAALIVAAVNELPGVLDLLASQASEIEMLREALGIRDATLARIKAAMEMAPARNAAETEAAILADHKAGLSLRQIAEKQSVGVGIVRGVLARQALKGTGADHG